MTFQDLPLASLTVLPAGPAGEVRPGVGPATRMSVQVARRAAPAGVALGVMLRGIGVASYSRDEAATLSAVSRPFPQLIRMLRYVDVFHGAYYVLMWPVVRVFGATEFATRLPSAVAMAVAAMATAAIATRLISPGAGVASGLSFAILPEVSLYGQTARPYAMATALAAVTTYVLVRGMQETRGWPATAGWLGGYAMGMAALGYIHPFALLLLAAHFVPVAGRWLRNPGEPATTRLGICWLAAGVVSVLIAEPLLRASAKQSAHISMTWTEAPVSSHLRGLTGLVGPLPMAMAAGLLVLAGMLVSLAQGRARLHARWPADLFLISLPWLTVPALLLIVYSAEYTSLYTFRYGMFCTPAAALLIGAGVTALGWRAGVVTLVAVAALGYSTQLRFRSPAGHGDNIRAADSYLAARERSGDAELYKTYSEPIRAAYAFGLSALPNVEVGTSAVRSATLGGKHARPGTVRRAVRSAGRIWYVVLASHQTPGNQPKVLRANGFVLLGTWHTNNITLYLYARAARPART